MKTEIEIHTQLLEQARAVAAREGTTLSRLVEDGLRQVLAEKKQPKTPYAFHLTTFRGDGLMAEFRDAGWDVIRDAIHEGRGGDRG